MEKDRLGFPWPAHAWGSVIFLPKWPRGRQSCAPALLALGAPQETCSWESARLSPPVPGRPAGAPGEETKAIHEWAHTSAPLCWSRPVLPCLGKAALEVGVKSPINPTHCQTSPSQRRFAELWTIAWPSQEEVCSSQTQVKNALGKVASCWQILFVGQLSSFSAVRLKSVASPPDLYYYGVKKIIGRMNTCPSCHLLARETPCKLLLHTRRCHTWKPSSAAITRLFFSHPLQTSALIQILFSSTLEILWIFQTGAFQHHPILSVTREKEMTLATYLGIGISALYPPPILLKIKHFLSLLSYEAS